MFTIQQYNGSGGFLVVAMLPTRASAERKLRALTRQGFRRLVIVESSS